MRIPNFERYKRVIKFVFIIITAKIFNKRQIETTKVIKN